MGWISPTSYSDPDSGWTSETTLYDANTATYASHTDNITPRYVELNLEEAHYVDKLQVYTNSVTNWVVDVYYSGGWNNIHSGAISGYSYQELAIGSTEEVTACRIKPSAAGLRYMNEVQFNSSGAVEATGDKMFLLM